MFFPDPKGVIKHSAIGNSSGLIATVQCANGFPRLSVASQLAPVAMQEARKPKIQWPMLKEEYRQLTRGEQIVMTGGLIEWLGESSTSSAETIDEWWRVYPKGLLHTVLPEMLGVESSASSDSKPPSSPKPNEGDRTEPVPHFRTGGIHPQGVMDSIVDTAIGPLKMEALFAGLAESTRKRYVRGWGQWCIFCETRKISPWVDSTMENWGEELLDFIMCELQVLKLHPFYN